MRNHLFKAVQCLMLSLLSMSMVTAQTPVDQYGALSVTGNQIVDQNGAPFSVAGNSFFWSNTGWGAEPYYNAQVVSWLKTDWNTAIMRAAMGVEDNGGYISDPTGNKNRVITLVDAAIAEGLYVLIDWHSHHAEDYQQQAISFFQEMATLYGSYDHVIYEIYNEPINSDWNTAIKPYAEAVIGAIRAIDPDNLIVVGSSTWSQDVDVASQNPITAYTNIAYSLHFYAGTHGQYLRNKATTAMNNGIAIMVTEYGTVNADGDGGVASQSMTEWEDYMEQNALSHLNWSVNDKAEGASVVYPGSSPTGNWSSGDLTPSGTLVRQIIQDWNGTPTTGDQLVLSSSALNLDENASTTNVGVTANVSWSISTSDSWITATPLSGSGNGNFDLQVSGNGATSSRSGTVTVTGGSLSRTISVTQAGEDGGPAPVCDTPTPASLPYDIDGVAAVCLEVEGSIDFVNSWNTELVEINGVDYTNDWSNNLPAPINGKYYIKYVGNFGWSHLEIVGTNARTAETSPVLNSVLEPILYPNPATNLVHLKNFAQYEQAIVRNLSGEIVLQQDIIGDNLTLPTDHLASGTYFVTVSGGVSADSQRVIQLVIK